MMDSSVHEADRILTDLVELVETARAVPISGSCLVPRERILDLLDELRLALPPEVAQARAIVAQRDATLARAQTEAQALTTSSTAAAGRRVADAGEHAGVLVADARTQAARLVDEGRDENARLISSAGVHQAATAAAAALRSEAQAHADATRADADAHAAAARADADTYSAGLRSDAEDYSAKLRSDAEDYAETTLSEIVAILQRSANTAEHGRSELAARRPSAAGPATNPAFS